MYVIYFSKRATAAAMGHPCDSCDADRHRDLCGSHGSANRESDCQHRAGAASFANESPLRHQGLSPCYAG